MERGSSLARDLQNQDEEVYDLISAVPIGGYDLSFVNDVDDFKCIVCLKVMRDPYQIVPCGHRFCRTCFDLLIRSANEATLTCPMDRGEISLNKIFPDNNCKRRIMCLQVLCKNSPTGCNWRSSLSELEDHIAKTCLYVETSCSFKGCESLFLKRQKEDHEAECKWRIAKCDFCSDDFLASELEEHINTSCPCKQIQCPINGCQKEIQRKMVQHHIDEDCLFAPKSCPVQFLGCQEKGTRSAVNKHIVENAFNHIELLCSELKSMNLRMIEHEKINQAVERQLIQLSRNASLLKEIEEQERANPTRMLCQAKDKGIIEDKLLFIWSIQLPVEDDRGCFESISPTYSTGSHGYFLRVKLDISRRVLGYMTGASYQLLPGPNDGLLPWPFNCKLSLYQIDASNEGKELFAKYDGRDDPEARACFQKPQTGGNPWYKMAVLSRDYVKTCFKPFKAGSLNDALNILVEIESYSAAERLLKTM